MKRKFLLLYFILSAVLGSVIAQSDDDAVAKAGYKKITRSEFIERFEMTPQLRKDLKNNTSAAKLEFIYTLLAEKLWALEAVDKGLDTTEVIKTVTSSFEKIFLRDAFYRREIKDKVTVSDKELIQGLARYAVKLKVNFIFSTDQKEIRNLYKLLKQGIPFDTVMSTGPEFNEQPEPIDVTFGQMQTDIEDSLYHLKIGEFTQPLYTSEGWYIFRVVNRIKSAFTSQDEKEQAHNNVEKLIKKRKETDVYREFYNKFFKKKKVDIDAQLFNSLSARLSDIFTERKKAYNIKDDSPVFIEAKDANTLETEFNDSLSLPFIKFNVEPMTIKDFIRLLIFDGFNSQVVDFDRLRKILSIKIGNVIEQELVSREAVLRGYKELPEVKNETAMWRDNYLFQLMQNNFTDTVKISEEEVLSYYNSLHKDEKHPMQVNIIEILADSLETVDKILSEIKNGADMKELAVKYTKREWVRKKGGEFGYFPVTAFGEIGRIAGLMQPGDIYGPLKVKEGYSIFKLIDKKEPPKDEHLPYAQVKEKLREELVQKSARLNIIKHTVDLAFKYGIDIDPKVFNSIETTTINTMTIRLLGFGGRMTAVPLSAPNVDWVEPYFQRKNVLP